MATTTSPTSASLTSPTAALDPALPLHDDVLSRLDYRTRRLATPRARALPGHYLAVGDAAGDEQVIPIESRVMHLGRSTAADIRFEDAHVSRRHAIVVRYGRHVRVLDDRSSAGTFVNGARIIAAELSDGDVVRLGPVTVRYVVVR
jgi:pSer/pThr/pTyr-binding forkhead associated (FHA) protein